MPAHETNNAYPTIALTAFVATTLAMANAWPARKTPPTLKKQKRWARAFAKTSRIALLLPAKRKRARAVKLAPTSMDAQRDTFAI